MPGQVDDLEVRQKRALDECQALIDWYRRNLGRQRTFYRTTQVLTIVLGALTPVFLLAQVHDIFPAITSAIATAAAGVSGVFHWQRNYVRFVNCEQSLSDEKLAFETRTGRYRGKSEDDALDMFTATITQVRRKDTDEWGQQVLSVSSNLPALSKDAPTPDR